MRMHHAHSLSVFVVFETLQTIFFSGALSVEWPAICVAWWSNFAWSAGMIYTPAMVNAINSFVGVQGNSSQVGGAGSVVINNGGGLISQIYGRLLENPVSTSIMKRRIYNASDPFDYAWGGDPVALGMPTPGTWYGFWAELAGINIPAASAFFVGLIWILVAIVLAGVSVLLLKAFLEILARMKWIGEDRLSYFRSHWISYLGSAVMKMVFISLFAVMTLIMFQLRNGGSTATTASTAITVAAFAVFFIAVVCSVALACRARIRLGKFEMKPDRIVFHRGKLFNFIPGVVPAWASTLEERELTVEPVFTISISRIRHINYDPAAPSVHLDQGYVENFGWLSARYRRTKWWFFAYYVVYLFGRATFLGAGVMNPLVQVYGLFVFEIVGFAIVVNLNPFEGKRNTALAVWMLSISKILTTGLSIAFLPEFNLDRIIATVIGVIIIVVQGLLVIGLIILIALSGISSWMSLTRNRDQFELDTLESVRVRYFEKMETKAADKYQSKKKQKGNGKGKDKEGDFDETLAPTEPSFTVVSVRRTPKIEDEDEDDVLADLESPFSGALSPDIPFRGVSTRASRTNSVSSQYSVGSLPRAGRAHRSSLSSRDFSQGNTAGVDRPHSSLAQRLDGAGSGYRTPSVRFADEVEVDGAVPGNLRGHSSNQSLRSGTSSRAGSPFSPGHLGGRLTPSRETLARYAEERSSRHSTSTPQSIPDVE